MSISFFLVPFFLVATTPPIKSVDFTPHICDLTEIAAVQDEQRSRAIEQEAFNASAPDWLGGTWRLVSHHGAKGKQVFHDDRPVLMTLSVMSTIEVRGGCNAKSGSFVFLGNRMEQVSLRSTMMACQESLMEVDDAMSRILSANPTVKRQGRHLTLTTASGEQLRFIRPR